MLISDGEEPLGVLKLERADRYSIKIVNGVQFVTIFSAGLELEQIERIQIKETTPSERIVPVFDMFESYSKNTFTGYYVTNGDWDEVRRFIPISPTDDFSIEGDYVKEPTVAWGVEAGGTPYWETIEELELICTEEGSAFREKSIESSFERYDTDWEGGDCLYLAGQTYDLCVGGGICRVTLSGCTVHPGCGAVSTPFICNGYTIEECGPANDYDRKEYMGDQGFCICKEGCFRGCTYFCFSGHWHVTGTNCILLCTVCDFTNEWVDDGCGCDGKAFYCTQIRRSGSASSNTRRIYNRNTDETIYIASTTSNMDNVTTVSNACAKQASCSMTGSVVGTGEVRWLTVWPKDGAVYTENDDPKWRQAGYEYDKLWMVFTEVHGNTYNDSFAVAGSGWLTAGCCEIGSHSYQILFPMRLEVKFDDGKSVVLESYPDEQRVEFEVWTCKIYDYNGTPVYIFSWAVIDNAVGNYNETVIYTRYGMYYDGELTFSKYFTNTEYCPWSWNPNKCFLHEVPFSGRGSADAGFARGYARAAVRKRQSYKEDEIVISEFSQQEG
jgi:hypothetical protein